MRTDKPFQLQLPSAASRPNEKGIIESQGPIVIIGANGSGKTRLGVAIEFPSIVNNLDDTEPQVKVHRIAAQKSLELPESSSAVTLDNALMELHNGYSLISEKFSQIRRFPDRWSRRPATHLLSDFEALMRVLFSEDYETFIRQEKSRKSISEVETNDSKSSKLNTLIDIWSRVLTHRKLEKQSGRIDAQLVTPTPFKYNASEMSDGERVIFYLAGQCLCAPPDATIIIDEPELHVHKTIQARLWDELERERPDCLFVYLTHDLDFAATRTRATKVWLKSFDGTKWDWDIIPESGQLPEAMLLELVGSRKPILFVEGERGSLDDFIYSTAYPDFTIVPSGGCECVIRNTRAFAALKSFHLLNCYGIVDRDYRSETEIENLR